MQIAVEQALLRIEIQSADATFERNSRNRVVLEHCVRAERLGVQTAIRYNAVFTEFDLVVLSIRDLVAVRRGNVRSVVRADKRLSLVVCRGLSKYRVGVARNAVLADKVDRQSHVFVDGCAHGREIIGKPLALDRDVVAVNSVRAAITLHDALFVLERFALIADYAVAERQHIAVFVVVFAKHFQVGLGVGVLHLSGHAVVKNELDAAVFRQRCADVAVVVVEGEQQYVVAVIGVFAADCVAVDKFQSSVRSEIQHAAVNLTVIFTLARVNVRDFARIAKTRLESHVFHNRDVIAVSCAAFKFPIEEQVVAVVAQCVKFANDRKRACVELSDFFFDDRIAFDKGHGVRAAERRIGLGDCDAAFKRPFAHIPLDVLCNPLCVKGCSFFRFRACRVGLVRGGRREFVEAVFNHGACIVISAAVIVREGVACDAACIALVSCGRRSRCSDSARAETVQNSVVVA